MIYSLAILALPLLIQAKVGLDGCEPWVSNDSPTPIFYCPLTGEICEVLDSGTTSWLPSWVPPSPSASWPAPSSAPPAPSGASSWPAPPPPSSWPSAPASWPAPSSPAGSWEVSTSYTKVWASASNTWAAAPTWTPPKNTTNSTTGYYVNAAPAVSGNSIQLIGAAAAVAAAGMLLL